MESQQKRNSDCHITITGEVAINLQSITINAHQILDTRIQSRVLENTLYKIDTDIIGNYCFLEETAHYKKDSSTEHLIGNK